MGDKRHDGMITEYCTVVPNNRVQYDYTLCWFHNSKKSFCRCDIGAVLQKRKLIYILKPNEISVEVNLHDADGLSDKQFIRLLNTSLRMVVFPGDSAWNGQPPGFQFVLSPP